MHLTSWLHHSPLRPGVVPRPWSGLADRAHATLGGQEGARKRSPAALWRGGTTGRGHAGRGGSRTEVSAVYTWEGRGLPVPGSTRERERGAERSCHARAGTRPGMPPAGPHVSGLRLLLGAANDGENVQEDVDDVRVEVQRSKHILLWAQGQLLVPQQQLSVHCQELGVTEWPCRGTSPQPSTPPSPPPGPRPRHSHR